MNKLTVDPKKGTHLHQAKNLTEEDGAIVTKDHIVVKKNKILQVCDAIGIPEKAIRNKMKMGTYRTMESSACGILDHFFITKGGMEMHEGMVKGWNNMRSNTGHEKAVRIYCHFGKLQGVGLMQGRLNL